MADEPDKGLVEEVKEEVTESATIAGFLAAPFVSASLGCAAFNYISK